MQFEIKTCDLGLGGSGSLLEDFGLVRRRQECIEVSEKQGCENLFGRL